MAIFNLPPPPLGDDVNSFVWKDWLNKLKQSFTDIFIGIPEGGTGTADIPTDGQILIGNGTGYTVANITAGENITITNGSGSITLAASGGEGIANAEGGRADTVYLGFQNVDGGNSTSVLSQGLDGGTA